MKKLALCALFAGLLLLSACAPAGGSEKAPSAPKTGVTINVYNWGEYISDGSDGSVDVNREFTKKTGIKVNYTTFSNNEELYAKLLGGGVDYDVIVPSDYMISKLAQEGMLAELDFSNIPNYKLLDESFRVGVEYDPENKYSVPYLWGMVGILYNTEMVDEPVESWKILWDEKYKKQIFMFDNPRDAFGVAQKLLGYSFNTTDEDEWRAAMEKLKEQKPLVQAYAMDQILDKMGNNEAALAPYYSGDSLTLREDNENIRFAVPKEGTNIFVDAFCVPKTSRKRAEAEAYINYMCSTEAAYANAEYVGYSSPHTEAAKMHREFLLEEFGEEGAEIAYPASYENFETFINLPPETNLLIDELWVLVKVGSNDDPLSIVLVIGAFFLVWVAVVAYKRVKGRKESTSQGGKLVAPK